MESLVSVQSVALTTDIWNSKNKASFLCVTSHFIDKSFSMSCKILAIVHIPEVHTALNLRIRLTEVISTWKLDGKISYVVTYNGASILKAVKDCGLEHLPCFAHTLNLVVKNSIEQCGDKSIVSILP